MTTDIEKRDKIASRYYEVYSEWRTIAIELARIESNKITRCSTCHRPLANGAEAGNHVRGDLDQFCDTCYSPGF